MKTFKHKAIATLTFVLFLGLQVFAGSVEQFKKEYHESFSVNSDVVLTVSNKFGFVKIVSSETDRITIDVEITIEAKNQEKAQKLLDQIKISISGNENAVTAITEISKNSKFKELNIDYTITMPVSGNVDITNKFGSFYLNEVNGSSKIYVAYGSADIGNLNSQTNDLTVKFGSGKVKYAHYLNYTTQYSSAKVGRAKLLNLKNQYGEVTVGEVGRMNLTNAYGDVELGTIVELSIGTKFGDIDVEGVISKLDLDTQYGDVDIAFVSKDFEMVEIHSSFGDVDIAFESGSNFILDGKASFGDISIPSGTVLSVDDSGNSESYFGKLYEGTAPATVKAKMSYGDLDISIH